MFAGAYTAIVTPFNSDGTIDYGKFKALIDMQAEGGMDGIVPVGTTGESPTIDFEEHEKIITIAVESSKDRLKVIAGTGANSTSEALKLTKHAQGVGADGTLQVTPYYNKPNQEGLYRHFSAVADLGLPVVLYNVPGRSGQEIAVETVAKLAEHPHVVALKEAGGTADRVSQVLTRCDITVLSGDDGLTFPMMALGGKGVISVASNFAPAPVADMVHLALDGKWEEARQIHLKYYNLFNDMFVDTNPIPVKAAMAMMGLVEEVYRLPMCPTTDANREVIRKSLQAVGLVE